MSEFTLRTDDGKIVKINTSHDVHLYNAPCNPPNTGTAYTSGRDLYAHKARSGKWYFYTYFWSMWQGTESSYDLVTEQEAADFLIEKAGLTGWAALADHEKERALEVFGRDIFEETA